MHNTINWFEIPANNFNRAVQFYQTILDIEIHETTMMDTKMGLFPSDQQNVSGAIVHGTDYAPSKDGSLIYLNGGSDLQTSLSRIEDAGGKVLVPKTQISPEFGYFALFIDTEGNKIGLHSTN